MPLKNALDDSPDIARFPGTVQPIEPFVDRFADHVGERETLLPQRPSFSQAILIQTYIHKARTHGVNIPRIYI